jgi:hypothetical protein
MHSIIALKVLDQPEAEINVTEIRPNVFFVDLGREIQGGTFLGAGLGRSRLGLNRIPAED